MDVYAYYIIILPCFKKCFLLLAAPYLDKKSNIPISIKWINMSACVG